jgi:periplasmic protein TonB
MIFSALALMALAPEEAKFVCQTDLPRKATKAKRRAGDIQASDYLNIHHQYGNETVNACVEVGVDGRVRSCTAHGGSDVRVDQHSCKVLTQRFRYEPAKDRKKRPINSFIIQKITWKLLEE